MTPYPKRWRELGRPELLGHLRGEVDGMPVVRWWRARRRCWEYEIVYPWALFYGNWRPEGYTDEQCRELAAERFEQICRRAVA